MTVTLSRPLAKRTAGLQMPAPETVEPDVADHVIQAASDALDRGETHYADRPGIPELRTLVAERLNARYGLHNKPGEVTITCGAVEARYAVIQLANKLGVVILCPGDTANIAPTALLSGVTIVRTAEEAPAGSYLYLTPADDVDAWVDQAEANGWWVIWDTTGHPAQPSHPAQRAALATHTFTIDDVEDRLPGWRVGWLVGTEKHAEARAFKQAMTICTTNVSQWATLELLRSEDA